jgi:hypothetical protein
MGSTLANGRSNGRWEGHGETAEQAALRLGCCTASICKMVRQGVLKKVPGGSYVRSGEQGWSDVIVKPVKEKLSSEHLRVMFFKKTVAPHVTFSRVPSDYDMHVGRMYQERLKQGDKLTSEEKEYLNSVLKDYQYMIKMKELG